MNWLNWGALLFASAGFAAWVVTTVNRLHSQPLSHHTLHIIRVWHDALIFGYPILLLWGTGFGERGLFRGGSWNDLSWGWWGAYAFGWIGAAGTVGHAWTYLLTPAPRSRIRRQIRRMDVEQELGFRPSGGGPYESLLKIPFNEVFRLEVATQEFALPRLPPEWDSLSILHLSDWHFIGTVGLPYFQYVVQRCREMQPDLIVFTGDLLDRQELEAWIPQTLGTLNAPLGCYFILGNHDWYLEPERTRKMLEDLGWVGVAGRSLIIEHSDRKLLIAGTEVPWMGKHPGDLDSEADFKLLLSHTPDHIRWACRQGFDLVLAGHNHGGQIRFPGFGPVYCPSLYGCRYASGIFENQGTLMCVSRGLSGRHPLRINCLPEITLLVLHQARESSVPSALGRTSAGTFDRGE